MFKDMAVTIKGVSPLLLRNGQLRDPLNYFSKELKKVSSKKNKADEDHIELARLDWYGGLYLNSNKEIIIPGENLESMIRSGAKKNKLGKQFSAAVMVSDAPLLKYKGSKNIDDLWNNDNFRLTVGVKIGQKAVMRCRPIFREWGLSFTIQYDESIVEADKVLTALKVSGQLCGLGDWIPKHGRFEVVQN